MIFNHSASEASAASRKAGQRFDCSESEWSSFSERFELGQDKPNCEATKHMNFQDADVCADQNVIFMYPYADHNNAFCINSNVCHRMWNWDSNACSVRMRRITSVQDAIDQLDDYSDNSLKHVVLGGHGSGGTLHWGEGKKCGVSHICVNSYSSNALLKKISEKMHQHGTIFLDSCLSATEDEKKFHKGMNLATWVASNVGKGIRVVGSLLSFGKVRVTRFQGWHARIDVKARKSVERVERADGALCPSWAESSTPDEDGDCKCPGEHPTCRTTEGKECPKSKGLVSNKYFLPMCAEDWANVTCKCTDESES
jgi:hypothetical protein